jgi:hypothetical protein
MATTERAVVNQATINIDVVPTGTGAPHAREGSFKEPWPLTRINLGTEVRFVSKQNKPFTVNFPDGSPFSDTVIQDSAFRATVNKGAFHYQISAFDGTNIWTIHRCPEIEVGP